MVNPRVAKWAGSAEVTDHVKRREVEMEGGRARTMGKTAKRDVRVQVEM